MEVEATYANGILKLDQPLPLPDNERVIVTVRPRTSRARQSAGILKWTGSASDLEYLLGPDNHPWVDE
jgi:predicted DNA-binding antitoxin AbrB/MazE fold protein